MSRECTAIDLEFRVEAFNLANRPNFADPNPYIDIPAVVGSITSTTTTPRQLQFALKLTFQARAKLLFILFAFFSGRAARRNRKWWMCLPIVMRDTPYRVFRCKSYCDTSAREIPGSRVPV